MFRLLPRIFFAQMIGADCTWLAIFIATMIAYRRRPIGSLLAQMISAGVLLACNVLTQSLQIAEIFSWFELRSSTAKVYDNLEGAISIAAMFSFATGLCWYYLRQANGAILRGFPVDVGTAESRQQ